MSDSFFIVLRRDYLELIESMAAGVESKVSRCAATLLSYYRHWQEWKQEHQRTDWLYQPLRQIYKDLMELFSIPVIRDANDLLIDLGLLLRRGNPGNGQDKTYQYNVRFDRLTQLLTETLAACPFKKTDVSAAIPNFSASPANTHHNIQFNKVTSSNQDAIRKEEPESSQEIVASKIQVEILTVNKEQEEIHRLIAESLDEAQSSAPTSIDSDEVMQAAESIENSAATKAAEKFLENLNTEAERKKRSRCDRDQRPLCVPGLDEEAHEVLWRHQAQLLQLNVDLHCERIQNAIADNPQHLESAIEAFFEANAKGPLEPKQATGFLYNALRSGWKPKQALVASSQTTRACYTPHPLMVEQPEPTTLEELVKRKRHQWQVAPILRSLIKVWVEQTKGVVIGLDGPELAAEGALTLSPTEPAADAPETLETSPEATTPSAAAPTPAAPEATAPTLTADSLAEAAPEATAPKPAASLTSRPGLADLPAALVPSPTVVRLNVGERVLWDNCPAHCASWNPFTISNIIGGMAWLDIYEKPVPLSDLRRAP